METAGAGSYDGGAGGKLRRRPPRRAATPYDRPPVSPRNAGGAGRNGWLSKLVDPASRIIANGASRIFRSVFRKPLPALPALEPNYKSPQVLPKLVSDDQVNKHGDDSMPNNSICSGIDEFEQLLKQKTFSRDEFNRLTELLRSRTVDLSAPDEKVRSDDDNQQRAEPGTSLHLPVSEEKGQRNVSMVGNGRGTSGLFDTISKPAAGLTVLKSEVASPSEVAKAYMGARPLRVSPTTLGLRTQAFREDPALSNIVPFNTPKSSQFRPKSSGLLSENAHLTPRPRGRSAIYSMARSPYIKDYPATALELAQDGHIGPSTLPQRRHDNLLSGGRQALKRRSSVFDNDFGSSGPIRRTRQKSNLITPSKTALSLPRTPFSVPLPQLGSDAKKPVVLDGPKYGSMADSQVVEDESNKIVPVPVPPQSSEMARKILQQLDKLVPSPKEKSSELMLALVREKPPSKLTTSMLNGRALRTIEEIESPKLQSLQGTTLLEGSTSGMPLRGTDITFAQKMNKIKENGPSRVVDFGSKSVPEPTVVKSMFTLGKDTNDVVANSAIHTFDRPQKKRAFRMSAPEDSLELDEDYLDTNTPTVIHSVTEKEKTVTFKAADAESGNVDDLLVHPSERSKPVISFVLPQATNMKEETPGAHSNNAKKVAGFTLPTNDVSTSVFNEPVMPKEQPVGPAGLEFGDRSVDKETTVTSGLPPNTISGNELPSFGPPIVSNSMASGSNAGLLVSSVAVSPEGFGSAKDEKSQKVGDSFRSSENVSSSAVVTATTEPVFAIAAPTNSSLGNGSLTSSSTVSSVSSTPPLLTFGSKSASTSSASASSYTTSSTSSFSLRPTFNFGSGSSVALPSCNVSTSTVASGSEVKGSDVQCKFTPASCSLPAATSTAVTGAGGSIFGFSASVASSDMNSSLVVNNQSSAIQVGSSTSGSLFGSQPTHSTSSTGSQFSSLSSQSPNFGLNASSSVGSTGTMFGSSSSVGKSFGSGSSFGMNSSISFASGSTGSFSTASTTANIASSTSSPFGLGSRLSSSATGSTVFDSTSQPASAMAANAFGSSSHPASWSGIFGSGSLPATSATVVFSSSSQPAITSSSATIFGSSSQAGSTGSVFGSGFQSAGPTASLFGLSSQPASSTANLFGTSSQPTGSSMFGSTSQTSSSTPSVFGSSSQSSSSTSSIFSSSSQPSGSTSIFGSNTQTATSSPFIFGASSPLPSAGFSFGQSTANGNGSFTFGSSSGATSGSPVFSFGSTATAAASATSFSSAGSAFPMSNPSGVFGSAAPANDQMNEDSMAEDTIQSSVTPVSSFGQAANSPSNFMFSSPSVQPTGSGMFQFGSQPNPATPQNPSPFSGPPSTLEVAPGGSFSLGAAGPDKSGRKIIRARRDKHRKK